MYMYYVQQFQIFLTYYVLITQLLFRWFSKRFLHPDIVAAYEYVFIWDEDLGVENFDPEKYARFVYIYSLKRFFWRGFAVSDDGSCMCHLVISPL